MPFGAAPPAPPCGGVGALLSAALQPGSSALELYALPPRADTTGTATAAVISMSLLIINTSIQLIQSRLNNSRIGAASVEGVVEACQDCSQARASPNTVSLCVNTLIPSCAQNQASVLINLLRV